MCLVFPGLLLARLLVFSFVEHLRLCVNIVTLVLWDPLSALLPLLLFFFSRFVASNPSSLASMPQQYFPVRTLAMATQKFSWIKRKCTDVLEEAFYEMVSATCTRCLKIQNNSHSACRAKRAMFTLQFMKNAQNSQFGEFLMSSSVTRQVNFNRTKN